MLAIFILFFTISFIFNNSFLINMNADYENLVHDITFQITSQNAFQFAEIVKRTLSKSLVRTKFEKIFFSFLENH
jgi:hypothetical protein